MPCVGVAVLLKAHLFWCCSIGVRNKCVMSLSLKYKVCPHCSRSLNIKTFKEHKRLFFSEKSGTWIHSNKNYDSGSDSSDISIEPGETSPPEPLYEETMNDGEFSSDIDMLDETPDGISQPSTSSDYGPRHDRQADEIGMSDAVHVLLVQPWYGLYHHV